MAPKYTFSSLHPLFSSPHPLFSSPYPLFSSPHPLFSSPHPLFSSPHPLFSSPHPLFSSPHPLFSSPHPDSRQKDIHNVTSWTSLPASPWQHSDGPWSPDNALCDYARQCIACFGRELRPNPPQPCYNSSPRAKGAARGPWWDDQIPLPSFNHCYSIAHAIRAEYKEI